MNPLLDQAERQSIKTALDQNIIVEAAAGTGKTTELVNRIVNVLREGRGKVDGIVAVTFTDKAAGELKLRLRFELEKARVAETGERLRNLEEALAHLEEAHVNTIHGFCADLLRERPVEAGVDPEFEAMPDPDAQKLYAEAFGLWLQEKLENPPEGVRRSLRRKSAQGPIERLCRAGWTLATWRDFEAPWRRNHFAREAEIDGLVRQLDEFADLTASPSNTRDSFYENTSKARRVRDDLRLLERVQARDYDRLEAEFVRLAFDTADEYKRFRDPKPGYGLEYEKGIKRADVEAAHQKLVAALQRFARAADADLAALLESELRETMDRYDQVKIRAGRLDFLDLLLRARGLIRDHEKIRAEFQRRFTHVFIDEFQDTDPLQVEILLLLASADPSIAAWRDVTPAPGKLFLVGDPKQAIYRFRRADVGIYQEVKKLLSARGALCLKLTTSFRGAPSIQSVINAAFAPVMTGDPTTLQAEYVPLSPYRQDHAGQPAIVALSIPKPYGARKLAASAIEISLPDAIGAFIQWLLEESQWTVTERDRPGERLPLSARHVCLLFRRFDSWGEDMTRRYIEALEARDIPHLLIGGKAFHSREEVETVRAALSAIEWPDDELSVFASLRGSFFAIGDDALLEYRHRYKRLHPFRIPKEQPPERLAPIFEALALFELLHRNRNYRPVVETIARLLEATRAYAGFALRPSGEQALANVLHIAELARQYDASGGISFRGFVERLQQDAEIGEEPEAPILEEGSEGVRMMTVHKAKGLEFPVVILADVTAKIARPRAGRHLDAERGLCAMQLAGWSPAELLDHNDQEVARDRAEGMRVAYVAATRARDLLVVPAPGDDPFEQNWQAINDWWIGPLSRAIYPGADRRRKPAAAIGCPSFGDDSVYSRPDGSSAADNNVCPGLHMFEAGTVAPVYDRRGRASRPVAAVSPAPHGSDAGSDSGDQEIAATGEISHPGGGAASRPPQYGVAWWDPRALRLGATPKFGIRQQELLQEVDPQIVAEARKNYTDWQARRNAAIEQGSRPTLVVRTATERVATATEPARPSVPESEAAVDVKVIQIARELERPAGPRYGALVHALLATAPLEAGRKETETAATLQARILGATQEEMASAVEVVQAVLSHPVMERARVSFKAGQCRREIPITLLDADGNLLEGIVDLAFREGESWTVVDFKTDRELEKRLDDYRRQVQLYAKAIGLTTGQKTSAILAAV